jgi:hypothetical protein
VCCLEHVCKVSAFVAVACLVDGSLPVKEEASDTGKEVAKKE